MLSQIQSGWRTLHHKDPPCPFYSHIPSLLCPSLQAAIHLFVPHFYNSVISTVLRKWDCTVHNLWVLAFFSLSIVLWRFIQVVSIVGSFFLLSSGCAIVYWTIHPLRDIWGVSSFWLLEMKLLLTISYRFLYEYKFSFFLGQIPRSAAAGM